ncbi:22818_t:CDS:2, partial [Racocetra persica]
MLTKLVEGIEKQIENEAKCQRESEYRNQLPSVGLPTIHSTFFSQINEILKKHLTFEALACQRLQISQSCLYHPYKINNLTFNQNDNLEYTAGFLENDYQEGRILLSSMLKLVKTQNIGEIWQIRLFSNLAPYSEHYIIVLYDGTHLCSYIQEIQNDESSSGFAIIEQIRGPDCVQVALDSDTINEFIGLMYTFIESKSIQVDNSLRSDIIGLITNPHVISHRGRPKKQLHDSLEVINKSNSHQILKSNKVLNESDITNKSMRKCFYCNNT